jgi:hypothetical protein
MCARCSSTFNALHDAGRTKRVVVFIAEHGQKPGLTRMDIRKGAQIPTDGEVTARIREAESDPRYGELDYECEQITKSEFRYWWRSSVRRKAQRLVARWLREATKKGERAA